MARRRTARTVAVAAAAVALVIPVLVALPTTAMGVRIPSVLTIGVDHAPPAGHDFEYTDFFPRSGLTVHTGDIVHFQWASSPDGFHNVAVLPSTTTPEADWAANPTVVPDADDGPQALQFNPAIGAPTNPSCGHAAAMPCPFDNSTRINSGPGPTDGTTSFYAQMNLPSWNDTTINFVCEVHPGMAGSITVSASSPITAQTVADAAATAQANVSTVGALLQEGSVNSASSTTDASGHKTFLATAGTASPHVEIVEFLPHDLSLTAGDRVTWRTTTAADIHTVTFPTGTHEADFQSPVCEGAAADTPPPCSDPSTFEQAVFPQPVGSSTISSPTQVSSSGIIDTSPSPSPDNYTFTFSTPGTFKLFCHVHENGMLGQVTVQAAAVSGGTLTPASAPAAQPVSRPVSFTG